MNNNRIDSLDSLRGIASMIVVFFHCLISIPIFYLANYKDQYSNVMVKFFSISPLHTFWAGNEAVLLFFILSGFVLSLPFLNNKAPSYLTYVIKRFFRIYVPYIVVMFISIGVMLVVSNFEHIGTMSEAYNNRWNHPVTLKAILAYILMINYDITNVNGVVWTLFHEMRISLIFPFLMLIISRFNWIKGLLISLGITMFMFTLFSLWSNLATDGLYSSFIYSCRESVYYTTFFIFGAIFAKCRKEIISYVFSLNSIWKYLLLLISLLFINNKWTFSILSYKNATLIDFFSCIGILILFSLVLSSKRLERFLTMKLLVFLGRVSYSLYLIHIPILMIVSIYLSKIISINLSLLAVPIVSIPVAWILYKLLELPSMSLGKRLSLWTQKALDLNVNRARIIKSSKHPLRSK